MTERLGQEFEREIQFNQGLIRSYLKLGSVDEVFKRANYDIPISEAGYHRLLDQWGIIKTAGPNTHIGEVFDMVQSLTENNISLERMYREFPKTIQTSLPTFYRIVQHIKEGITRRCATALIVTPADSPQTILVGYDKGVVRNDIGKQYGSLSLPMTFSKKNEPNSDSIARVLQREVFADLTVNKKFPEELLLHCPNPFLYFSIADVYVSVFKINLPRGLVDMCASDVLSSLSFVHASSILGENCEYMRAGVAEIVQSYVEASEVNQYAISKLNLALAS